jgi:hypothetical protein
MFYSGAAWSFVARHHQSTRSAEQKRWQRPRRLDIGVCMVYWLLVWSIIEVADSGQGLGWGGQSRGPFAEGAREPRECLFRCERCNLSPPGNYRAYILLPNAYGFILIKL